jgi:HEAT repeat protein
MCDDKLTSGQGEGPYRDAPSRSRSRPWNRRIPVVLYLLPATLIVAGVITPARAENDSVRVDRLFLWASSGEVRFQDKVGPAKDSLAVMGERAARWLARKMDATDARERRTLADLFEKIGPAGAPSLIPYLDSNGIYMPQNAARCLGLAKDTNAAVPLTRKLSHPYYAVRSEVATALGKIGDRRGVVPLLSQLAREEDGDVRKSCVVSLGLLADPQVTNALVLALSDPFFGVRQTAVISLDQIKPPPVTALIASARTLSGIGLYGALVALGGCDEKTAREFLIGMLEDPSPLIRGFAIEGLSVHADKHVRKRVEKLKQTEKDPFVMAQIARLERRRTP